MTKNLQKFFVLLPILYLFIAVFVLRGNVKYVYVAAGILVVLAAATHYKNKVKPEVFLAHWMAILGVIGLSAAAILSIEKVELLADPNRIASCSLSPIVACSPVIASWQASAFGFPNSFIGIFGFTAIFTAAMSIMAVAVKLNKAWWRTLLAGIVAGAAFCCWLIYQGIFVINKLCLYCMLVWLVTFALLWLVSSYMTSQKIISFGTKVDKLLSYKYELIATTYTVIFAIIFFRWSDYWMSLF